MNVLHRFAHLAEDAKTGSQIDRLRGDERFERVALNELAKAVWASRVLAYLEQGNDVFVVEARQPSALAQKPLAPLDQFGLRTREQRLDRTEAVIEDAVLRF